MSPRCEPNPNIRRGPTVEFNGETDHLHLLVHYPPKVSPSRLVGPPQGRLCPQAPSGVSRTYPQVPVG
ncbi:transposase [Streptomyces sp. NPDC056938]|uniref:transposase n=1 Tax=unclassified Streptomyces TaxID=2593676 RepID=UPI0036420076